MCPLMSTGGPPPLEWDNPELVTTTELAGRGDWVCCCSGGSADWRSARSSSGGLIIAGVRSKGGGVKETNEKQMFSMSERDNE